jgi:glycosyltransferase involved in cell wall biosynthesis
MKFKKKIVWVTAECFIDVDIQIIPFLSNYYDIKWIVVKNKISKINYKELIDKLFRGMDIDIDFFEIKSRTRNIIIIREYISLISFIKSYEADIYYFDFSGIPYFFPLLRLFKGKKDVVIAAHNVSTPKGAVNTFLATLYMKFILHSFDNFQVFSLNQEKVIKNKTKNKNIFYAPLALKNFGSSNISQNEIITFLSFGYIRRYKRIDVLISAANLVFEKTKKKFLVKIFGSCTEWNKYKDLIKYPFLFDLRIDFIPNEEISDIFTSSHYFVLPYQDIAQSGAMTVAFNYNLPVIASNIDSFR